METAVVRKYARWCWVTAARATSYPIDERIFKSLIIFYVFCEKSNMHVFIPDTIKQSAQ